ncbi:hypothetical protein EA472_07900 [Natrarchaeobius oligotrophus]|uniref:Uncharacterized protein n=1 Tax=Natrarchaeobius chitinivorans TaxID=1679083 RepID=A0A3N6MET3_NATCH|nr:hypothetical protein EA472_07900 [Natrarchaeobius chitinivorans]
MTRRGDRPIRATVATESKAPTLALLRVDDVATTMPSVELDEETIQRLDALKIEDESYDELITELINIYETSELTLFRAGD